MKTYKVDEIIKMLRENPKLKIEAGYNETGFVDACFLAVIIDADYRIAQEQMPVKSVTFMEAVNSALENGNRLKYEKWNNYYALHEVLKSLSFSYNDKSLKSILNGNWNIEEEE